MIIADPLHHSQDLEEHHDEEDANDQPNDVVRTAHGFYASLLAGEPFTAENLAHADVPSADHVCRPRLVVAKRRATAAVAVMFLAVTVWGSDRSWAGYVQATAETALIGGLADWFAVTALFRRPLGLPIPHTAVVLPRVADWLADPAHSEQAAAHLAETAVALADLAQDDDVHTMVEDMVRARLEAVPLAPLAGLVLHDIVRALG